MSNKIFWCFDAFENSPKTNIFVGETLASLNEKLKAEIHPVYVLGSEIVDAGLEFSASTSEAVSKAVGERFETLLKSVKIPGVLSPKVIVEHNFSKTNLVKNFINYAEKNGATLVVVGSHGKNGFDRTVLGSFAETLLLHCHLPVMVVGQNFDQIPKLDKILFPTDFSDDSSYAFHKAIDLAKVLSAKITLFHHLSPIIDPIIQSAMAPFGGVWTSYRDEMTNLKQKKLRLLEEWVEKAKASKVEVKAYLDSDVTDSSEAILSYAKTNNIGVIAMAAESGQLATTLFGAITRKVVRQSPCPVWLLRRR